MELFFNSAILHASLKEILFYPKEQNSMIKSYVVCTYAIITLPRNNIIK